MYTPQPTVEDPATPKDLPSTSGLFYNVMSGNPMFDAFYAAGTNYIDSRDGAEAHVKALEVEAAGGERLIISSRTFRILVSCRAAELTIVNGYRLVQLARLA